MTVIRILLILAAVVVALRLVGLLLRRFGPPSNVVNIRADDPGLVAARDEARATLPEFLRRLEAPDADRESAAVKAPLLLPGGDTEHVWLSAVRHEEGTFVGRVGNTPHSATGVAEGDERRVPAAEISDWQIVERGRLVGGYSIRFFLDRMPAAHRSRIVAGLPYEMGDTPLPAAG